MTEGIFVGIGICVFAASAGFLWFAMRIEKPQEPFSIKYTPTN